MTNIDHVQIQCKSLAPEYELLGETFASSADVMVAQVDADKHKELASRFGVSGFPTLKWVAKGTSFDKAEDVNSARTAEEMLKYINDKTGLSKKLKGAAPSSVTEISPANVEALTSGQKSKAFIGFFAPWYVFPPAHFSAIPLTSCTSYRSNIVPLFFVAFFFSFFSFFLAPTHLKVWSRKSSLLLKFSDLFFIERSRFSLFS